MEDKNYNELWQVISNYINWNNKDFLKWMKEIKENDQEPEFVNEHLSVYKKEFQIELLTYFFKNA